MSTTTAKLRRCAIYTRKSSDEGLAQDFNSLHAQREACAAFIQSQQGEGWQLIETAYDDGGFSGGSMARPGLTRLLADIGQGLIDAVVVYKVDRLTRSLADFARMVELFAAQGVSFVAVTQQFNTTSSMGRLTLNVLLSFAQFEREVTGERIRDKIAASKKKGMWLGGCAPLGYDIRERRLVINPAEAATVKHIFERFAALGSVRLLKAELDHGGLRSKRRLANSGSAAGGCRFSRGALYKLLANPIYVGQVRHHRECHPGQHQAIIDPALWEAVRRRLRERTARSGPTAKVAPSPLAGKLFTEGGEAFTSAHALNHGRRYRYYTSPNVCQEDGTIVRSGWRLPAREIELAVAAAARAMLDDQGAIAGALSEAGFDLSAIPPILAAAHALGQGPPVQLITDTLERAELKQDGINVVLTLAALIPAGSGDAGNPQLQLSRFFPMVMQRRGLELKLIIPAAARPVEPEADRALLKALARSRQWVEDLIAGRASSLTAIARRAGLSRRYVARLLPLAFLAPAIVEAIVSGHQPPGLTAEQLTRRITLPPGWDQQQRAFGSA